jgi:hypothetical protein
LHKTTDESIDLSRADDGAQLSGCIPLMNPKDSFQVTITLEGTPDIQSPVVSARAVGVTAQPRSGETGLPYLVSNLLVPIAASLSVILAITAGMSWWTSRKQSELSKAIVISAAETKSSLEQARKETQMSLENLMADFKKRHQEWKTRQEEYEHGIPSREQHIFAVLNRSGLGHLIPALIMTGDELPYWKTGLFLMHSFLEDEENGEKYVEALSNLMSQEMVPSSYGFLAYLAGKIEQERGKKDSAIAFFQRCKTKAPLTYEHLMAQDPAYDLDVLRRCLRASQSKETEELPNQ